MKGKDMERDKTIYISPKEKELQKKNKPYLNGNEGMN